MKNSDNLGGGDFLTHNVVWWPASGCVLTCTYEVDTINVIAVNTLKSDGYRQQQQPSSRHDDL